MTPDTTSQAFFEAKYKASEDPWNFSSSLYEQRRYAATLAALNHRHYRRALEPGCSVGGLTAGLAAFCEQVEAMDISPTAVAQARSRTQHLLNVRTTCGALPALIPSGTFDLVVFSEIGYYFTREVLFTLASSVVDRICPSGVFLAVHWLGDSPDHLLSGDTVHEVLHQLPHLTLQLSERHTGFRLDRWIRA